jgi:hypothetical protein
MSSTVDFCHVRGEDLPVDSPIDPCDRNTGADYSFIRRQVFLDGEDTHRRTHAAVCSGEPGDLDRSPVSDGLDR